MECMFTGVVMRFVSLEQLGQMHERTGKIPHWPNQCGRLPIKKKQKCAGIRKLETVISEVRVFQSGLTVFRLFALLFRNPLIYSGLPGNRHHNINT